MNHYFLMSQGHTNLFDQSMFPLRQIIRTKLDVNSIPDSVAWRRTTARIVSRLSHLDYLSDVASSSLSPFGLCLGAESKRDQGESLAAPSKRDPVCVQTDRRPCVGVKGPEKDTGELDAQKTPQIEDAG